MKRRSFLIAAAIAASLGTAPTAFARSAPLEVVISILPQKSMTEAIGGEFVNVTLMVPPGVSSATYEITPDKMIAIENADLYITLDAPHEKHWMPQVETTRPDLPILHLKEVTSTRTITGRVDASGKEIRDPHIWIAAPQLRDIARATAKEMGRLDPEHAKAYAANADAWITRLDAADAEAAKKLAPYKGKAFLVYHPAWGYLADSYGLRQVAIEHHGMEPGPKMIAKTIDVARAEDIRVIFVQKQFSEKEAETIAKEINGEVVKLNPQHPDPIETLNIVADAFVKSFQ